MLSIAYQKFKYSVFYLLVKSDNPKPAFWYFHAKLRQKLYFSDLDFLCLLSQSTLGFSNSQLSWPSADRHSEKLQLPPSILLYPDLI
jgi:hypothetical protein